MTDNAIVPVETGGNEVISFGQGHLSGDQLIPPRVKIVQQMSQERVGGEADAGDFYNTLTSENLGSTVKFLPLTTFMNRVLLVRDEKRAKVEAKLRETGHLPAKGTLSEGDGLKCRSLDMFRGNGEPGIECSECPLSQWDGNVPPLCSEVYNVASLTELGELIILQFQKSSAKAGKKFFSMLRFAGPGVAPWSRFYVVDTHEEQIKGKGAFFVPTVKKTPEVPPTELMRQASEWSKMLGGQIIDVTPTEDEEAESGGHGGVGEGGDSPF